MVLLGLVPAAIAAAVVVGALVALFSFINPVAAFLTGFADHWSSGTRTVVRDAAAIAVAGIALLLAIVTFTSLTVTIGDPFYEKISEQVENRLGGIPDARSIPWWREVGRSIRDSIRLLGLSAAVGVPLFLCGLIPVVGQTVVPAVGALLGGWMLAVELTGVAFARRGMGLADRRRILRQNRPLAVGFGATVFVCFLIPFGAIVLMPAAVAGATLLARRTLGLPIGAAQGARPLALRR